MKVYLDTVGCRLNQSEIETLLFKLKRKLYGIKNAFVSSSSLLIERNDFIEVRIRQNPYI